MKKVLLPLLFLSILLFGSDDEGDGVKELNYDVGIGYGQYRSDEVISPSCEYPYKPKVGTEKEIDIAYKKSIDDFKVCIDKYIDTYKKLLIYKDEISTAKREWNDFASTSDELSPYALNDTNIQLVFVREELTCMEIVDELEKLRDDLDYGDSFVGEVITRLLNSRELMGALVGNGMELGTAISADEA